MRDTQERGRDLEQVLATYANFVKPAFEEFCLPVSVQFFLFIIFLVDNIMLIRDWSKSIGGGGPEQRGGGS